VLGGSPCESLGLITGEHHDSPHALAALLRRLPSHPYALLADASAGPGEAWPAFRARFDAAGAFLLDHLAKAGHTLSGRLETLTAHVTTHGTLRLTNLSPLSVHRGDVSALSAARVVFVGVEGVGAFDPSFVGRSLQAILGKDHPGALAGIEVRTVRIPWARSTGGLLPAEVARDLDDPERREAFVAEVAGVIGGATFTHAVIAPVLGIERHPEVLELLARRTGVVVSEPLVPPPHAIHGLRMQKALDRALAASRVRLVNARVTGAEIAGKRILSLEGEDEAGPVRIRAEGFVLATGRFLGGGLTARGTLREAIFGLPVFHRTRPVGDRAVFNLLRPGYFTRQPLFDAGLRASSDLRPLDADDRVAYENLLVAGTILGGYDLALDGTGPGVDLLTGFAAGERAASGEA
jgi:glycerol-3-phosphate dehydrogenase subunit B